jgi:hypothetical protein
MRGTTAGGRRIYICGGYIAYLKGYCQHNTVREDVIVKSLVDTLRQTFLQPERLQRLRQRMADLEAKQRSPENLRRMQQRIDNLKQQIEQGMENLLAIPKSLATDLGEKICQKEKERDELIRELARMDKESPGLQLEQQIKAAESMLWRLEDAVKEEDFSLLRDLFRTHIAKIELTWTHERKAKLTRCHLAGGEVTLRASEEVYHMYPWASR